MDEKTKATVKELGSKVVLPDTFETESEEAKDECDLLQLMDSC